MNARQKDLHNDVSRKYAGALVTSGCSQLGQIPEFPTGTFVSVIVLNWNGWRDTDPVYHRWLRLSELQGERAERLAIGNAAVAIFSSTWAARSTFEDYRKDVRSVRVIPVGANRCAAPFAERVAANIAERSRAALLRNYATVIVSWWQDPDAYADLCRSSREEYEQRLNWNVSIDRPCRVLEEVCAA